jgi:hypothetical protein
MGVGEGTTAVGLGAGVSGFGVGAEAVGAVSGVTVALGVAVGAAFVVSTSPAGVSVAAGVSSGSPPQAASKAGGEQSRQHDHYGDQINHSMNLDLCHRLTNLGKCLERFFLPFGLMGCNSDVDALNRDKQGLIVCSRYTTPPHQRQ